MAVLTLVYTTVLVIGTAVIMLWAPKGLAGYIAIFMAAPIALLILVMVLGVRDLAEAADEEDIYTAEHRTNIGGGLIFLMGALVLILTFLGL